MRIYCMPRQERLCGLVARPWCGQNTRQVSSWIPASQAGFASDEKGSGSSLYVGGGKSAHKNSSQEEEFQWYRLISRHASCRRYREALKAYEEMQEEGVKPSTYTFVQALKACSSLGDLEAGKIIHAHVIDSGNESHMFVATSLVDMYVKCGSMLDALRVFDKLPHRDVVSWSAIILGCAKVEEGGELALQLYACMQQEGVEPNDRTFVATLKACSSLAVLEEGADVDGVLVKVGCLEKGRAIHSQIVHTGFHSDPYVGNTLIDMYVKCGSMMDAWHVFDNLPRRDVVSWNAMILGYAQKEEGELALQVYALMQQEHATPDDRTFVGVLKACSALAALEEGKQVDHRFLKVGGLEKGRSIHSQVVNSGCDSDAFVGNTLIDMYAKCGNMDDARHVFDKLPRRDVVSWTAMILGHVEQGENEEAFKLYAQIQEEGLSPNSVTFVGILQACGNTAGLETGREIHAHICRLGLETADIVLANALIDMYGKCGSMVDAQQVFDALPKRNLVTWNALIRGLSRQGDCQVVFDLFQRMGREGIHPNEVTFLSVLALCSHAGLVDKGYEYFKAISNKHGLTPTIEHYNCMVDLLGRAGQVDNAVAFVKKMPFQPDLVTWMTVLGACQKWTNVEVGRQAFERAVELDKNNAAAYFLMSNIYADAGMWEEREKIQATREKVKAWKKPGQSSWNEIGGHTFAVGDTKHPQSKDIYAKLKHLSAKMKEG